ncbi:uncharacterized protein [Epargyreus clarus]|uniref:uncharacterized protein n=1 Tax=Epargyreus clarus TaxID=520877 RepID=UPI003C2C5BD2
MVYLFAFVFLAVHCYCALINSSTTESNVSKHSNIKNSTYPTELSKSTLLEIEENDTEAGKNDVKTRIKRQQSSGAGKFTEAAKTPQLKMLRLFLTMFKNIWAKSYVGGAHPFHHNVPKPVVQLFHHRIVEFFFPDIGEETVKI